MTRIEPDALPAAAGLTMVDNGTEDGITWTRLTDGMVDYMVHYNPATGEETVHIID